MTWNVPGESINQVYGSIIEFLGGLKKNTRDKIELWLFDDMCHLKPFSEKESVANQTEITKKFSEMKKCVDKFHFKSHKKTDEYR